MTKSEKIYRKSPDIISRKIADETILVPIRQRAGDLDSIYILNEVAARIWELLDGKNNFLDIRNKIAEEFKVAFETAGKDIEEFLKSLEKVGALKER